MQIHGSPWDPPWGRKKTLFGTPLAEQSVSGLRRHALANRQNDPKRRFRGCCCLSAGLSLSPYVDRDVATNALKNHHFGDGPPLRTHQFGDAAPPQWSCQPVQPPLSMALSRVFLGKTARKTTFLRQPHLLARLLQLPDASGGGPSSEQEKAGSHHPNAPPLQSPDAGNE